MAAAAPYGESSSTSSLSMVSKHNHRVTILVGVAIVNVKFSSSDD